MVAQPSFPWISSVRGKKKKSDLLIPNRQYKKEKKKKRKNKRVSLQNSRSRKGKKKRGASPRGRGKEGERKRTCHFLRIADTKRKKRHLQDHRSEEKTGKCLNPSICGKRRKGGAAKEESLFLPSPGREGRKAGKLPALEKRRRREEDIYSPASEKKKKKGEATTSLSAPREETTTSSEEEKSICPLPVLFRLHERKREKNLKGMAHPRDLDQGKEKGEEKKRRTPSHYPLCSPEKRKKIRGARPDGEGGREITQFPPETPSVLPKK